MEGKLFSLYPQKLLQTKDFVSEASTSAQIGRNSPRRYRSSDCSLPTVTCQPLTLITPPYLVFVTLLFRTIPNYTRQTLILSHHPMNNLDHIGIVWYS